MSRKNMKNNKTYRDISLDVENEPEEGEIVDDYDLIVSSDEELCMRQRIRELEAENEEIEQIAVISRSYGDKIKESRVAQVPIDVSSISLTEYASPRKRKSRKSKERKRKHCHHQHQHLRYDLQIPLNTRLKRSHCRRRQKLCDKKRKQSHSDRFVHKELNTQPLPLEALESFESSSLTDVHNYGRNTFAFKRKSPFNSDRYIARDTLHLAVARNMYDSKVPLKKSCLKDKLLRQDIVEPTQVTFKKKQDDNVSNYEDDDVQVIENDHDIQAIDEDTSDSMEEKELRLIALKSAVLKKHMARKMRNAEVAYSPTDFDEMLSSGILCQDSKLSDIDDVDLEAEESQSTGETVSPETSPQLMMLDDNEESQQMDCKPIDMDIANSDSEDATIDSWSKDIESSLSKFSLENHNLNKSHYEFYIPEIHEPPPPPFAVNNYDNVPPSVSYNILCNVESQDMELDKEVFPIEQHQLGSKEYNIPEDRRNDSGKTDDQESEDKEEEEALRALLLSRFHSPKNQRQPKKPHVAIECSESSNKNKLPNVIKTNPKPTEIILKEAVKRLKINSQSDIHNTDTSEAFRNKRNCINDNTPQNRTGDSYDSLLPLQKLRKHLNHCKNMAQMVATPDIADTNTNTNDSLFQRKDVEETAMNLVNSASDEHSINSNSLEVKSKVDINDITRRLQKIKENVLSSNCNLSSQALSCTNNGMPSNLGNYSNKRLEKAERKESSQPFSGNTCQIYQPLTNTSFNMIPTNNLCSPLTNKKTDKNNFNAASNQATSEIRVTNNAPFKADVTNTLNKIDFKEENTANLALKINENSTINEAADSERLLKLSNTTTEASPENLEVTKHSSVETPTTNNMKVTPTPAYSLLRSTKIVKPNKVINANFELNSKPSSQGNEAALMVKISKPETNSQTPKVPDNSRLITSIDQVKHMCVVPPIVISVQISSNESSENDDVDSEDTLCKPLRDYNDNISPLSLNLESPSQTPLRSNSPTEPTKVEAVKSTALAGIQLKNQKSEYGENVANKKKLTSSTVQSEKISKTPLAVRHLPAEAQREYRRLLYRMKLLENKRKLADIEERRKEWQATKKIYSTAPTLEDENKEREKDKADSLTTEQKTSLVKKVLLKNANSNTALQLANGSSSSTKLHKGNVLRSYENLYFKFGAGIVNNLDKSLTLVEEAKKAKIEKLKLEARLKILRAEMELLQTKHREEQQKITRIYPNICATNEVITSLKQKRSKVLKAALSLGKSVQGDIYRLNNDLKESIAAKSKALATEIKLVNSLKVQDIANLEEGSIDSSSFDQSKNNKIIEVKDYKLMSHKELVEIKMRSSNDTKETVACPDRGKENDEQNTPTFPLTSEVGGNKELQELEFSDSRDANNRTASCRLDKDTTLNSTDMEKNSKATLPLALYTSPLEHLRNIDSDVDPNGVICPYDLMGNCEDIACKYVHLIAKAKT